MPSAMGKQAARKKKAQQMPPSVERTIIDSAAASLNLPEDEIANKLLELNLQNQRHGPGPKTKVQEIMLSIYDMAKAIIAMCAVLYAIEPQKVDKGTQTEPGVQPDEQEKAQVEPQVQPQVQPDEAQKSVEHQAQKSAEAQKSVEAQKSDELEGAQQKKPCSEEKTVLEGGLNLSEDVLEPGSEEHEKKFFEEHGEPSDEDLREPPPHYAGEWWSDMDDLDIDEARG